MSSPPRYLLPWLSRGHVAFSWHLCPPRGTLHRERGGGQALASSSKRWKEGDHLPLESPAGLRAGQEVSPRVPGVKAAVTLPSASGSPVRRGRTRRPPCAPRTSRSRPLLVVLGPTCGPRALSKVVCSSRGLSRSRGPCLPVAWGTAGWTPSGRARHGCGRDSGTGCAVRLTDVGCTQCPCDPEQIPRALHAAVPSPVKWGDRSSA